MENIKIKRRLDEQTVKKFGLGFANGTGNDLRKYLLSQDGQLMILILLKLLLSVTI